jgi:hypothetical protein
MPLFSRDLLGRPILGLGVASKLLKVSVDSAVVLCRLARENAQKMRRASTGTFGLNCLNLCFV